MADYGIKISKPEHDVKTADWNNLIFHSSHPALKIAQRGDTTLSVDKDDLSKTKEISHGLGYTPMAEVYMQYYSYAKTKASTLRKTAFSMYHGTQFYTHYSAYTDNDNLYIKFEQNGEMDEDATFDIRYYIYHDPQP